MSSSLCLVEQAGVENGGKRQMAEIGFDDTRVGVERGDDAAHIGARLGCHFRDLVDDDDVGELDLFDQKIDERAFVVRVARLAAVAQKVACSNSRQSRFAASTTDTIVSSLATSESAAPVSSRKENVAATGSGSAMPVPSISR